MSTGQSVGSKSMFEFSLSFGPSSSTDDITGFNKGQTRGSIGTTSPHPTTILHAKGRPYNHDFDLIRRPPRGPVMA